MKVFYNYLLKFKFFRKCFYENEFSNLCRFVEGQYYGVDFPLNRVSYDNRRKYYYKFLFCWFISLIIFCFKSNLLTFILPIIFFVGFIYSRYRYKKTKCKSDDFYYLIEQKLAAFISNNNYYETEKREREKEKDGKFTIEKYDVVINYMRIEFGLVDKLLYIKVVKKADKFLQHTTDLEEYFKVLFGYKFVKKNNTNSYCQYLFNLSNVDDRLHISNDCDCEEFNEYIDDEKISLSSDLVWNFTKSPHALICGSTGGGKSTFIDYLIIEFLKRKADVYICDPKQSDLSNLSLFFGENSSRVVGETNHIARVVREVYEEMNRRYRDYIKNPDIFQYGANYVDYGLNPVVLFVDEFTSLKISCDKKTNDEIMGRLTEIILKGRQVGVTVILSTQQPNANSISTEIRDNLSLRVSLGALSSEGYRMAFGSGYDLKNIQGVGVGYIYINGLGWDMPLEFQSPYMELRGLEFTKVIEKLCS